MAKITFHLLSEKDLDLVPLLLKWANNPNTKHLMTPNFDEKELEPTTREKIEKSLCKRENHEYYMIKADDQWVGTVSLDIDPVHLARTEVKSGWIGIGIGEDRYRGLGIGKATMAFIEQRAKQLGAKRMELGVFEFNSKAIAFYEKEGYHRFAEIHNFTYWKGKWYKDFRYEKNID